ncbi:MAG: ABC transporter permease [Bacteroidetes bacterium]|nr:MAG: ABC transporter permease [Bacteroidota bacterium]
MLALSYGGLAFLAGSTRTALLESLSQEYIRTARAAGINETRIYLKLALKNALLPAITTFATLFAGLIGGSVIIEKVFSLNGMGEKFLESALSNDTTALLALFPLSALMTMTGFLLADLSYALLDPKIRFRRA